MRTLVSAVLLLVCKSGLAGAWHTTTGGCQVWNEQPQANEVATWTGDCVTGRASGEGALVWTYDENGERTSERFEGYYREGKANGYGRYYFSSGGMYEGDFKNNYFDGHGSYFFANGNRYEGFFENGAANGQGKTYFVNGDVYVGDFKNNLAAGGTYTWANGETAYCYQNPDGSWVFLNNRLRK